MSRKWTLLLAAMVVVVIVLLLLLSTSHQPSSQQITPVAPQQFAVKNGAATAAGRSIPTASPPDPHNFADCRRLTKDKDKAENTWLWENYEQWDRYLAQGYSLDEITQAIDYLGNSNFAEEFRIKQLRKHSQLTQDNLSIQKTFEDNAPDDVLQGAKALGFKLQRKIPVPDLAEFMALDDAEKAKRPMPQQVSIDDVAYFLIDIETKEADIQRLLTHLENPAATVGYDKIATTSLLDYAIYGNRAGIVKQLLDAGVQPSNDRYLGSSQEWALINLSDHIFDDKTQVTVAVDIVNMLLPYDLGARFSAQDDKNIEGYIPRNYFRFEPPQVRQLMQDYGLDLMEIPQRDAIALDVKHRQSPLITELSRQRAEYLNQQFGIDDSPVFFQHCHDTLAEVRQRWQVASAPEQLKQLQQQYPDAPDLLMQQAAKIDPLLVDWYRQQTINSFPQRFVPESDAIFAPLNRDDDIDAAIKLAEQHQLSDVQKNNLFFQMLGYDGRYYRKLANSALYTVDVPYYILTQHNLSPLKVQRLEEGGADLANKDDHGKTLVYYAALQHNVALLNYLQQQGYPFDLDEDNGEDPLHAVLFPERYQFSAEHLLEMVDILMRYQPTIDEFHLRRMALLKLLYPLLYQQLSHHYPQLSVTDDMALPSVKPN
ncbi:hypothetical protein HR45_02055 [Shewanella mangrovi]|uniref:Uncharacterized protein n=1 Tax=Shewanella mangrovi TaxID=1515746 RepID=A0A094LVE3_9GAMM|nr:ankyrin repeat domain-containing protein [Shewanella mangrovi]KFZ39198.1 hypothetical protein HR45_02055 [Shewanella mangrovi]